MLLGARITFYKLYKQKKWPKVKNAISKLAIIGSFIIYSSKEENFWYKSAVLKLNVYMDMLAK